MRRRYGSSPLHLVAHLLLFALTAYVLTRVLDARGFLNMVVWLVGAALVHDLVFAPGYSIVDRALQRIPGAINYVRAPALISGALLLVWFPLILVLQGAAFQRVSGFPVEGYAVRWAIATAVLFGLSALLFTGRAAARRRHGDR